MRRDALRLTFRNKVVLLAVLLVAAIQLGTLGPLLRSIKRGQQAQAQDKVELAGAAFDEYMQNRTNELTVLGNVLVADSAFRVQVELAEKGAIQQSLGNFADRVGTKTAAVFDISGNFLAGTGDGSRLGAGSVLAGFVDDPDMVEPFHSIAFIGDEAYETISIPSRNPTAKPVPDGWVTLAYPIDDRLAAEISALTRLDVTFVRFGVARTTRFATTIEPDMRDSALAGVHLGEGQGSNWGDAFVTQLRPFLSEDDGLYVALQLPVADAMGPYVSLRNGLLLVAGLALIATLGAAFWLSRMVTRPIQRLVEAAGRMREGIYSQPIEIHSQDEFGVLAAGFNSMQKAIANREQDIVHMAHHDSLSGLPTREIVVSEIRDAVAEADQLAIINFVLHRFDELASSLGHRTADRLIQLVAGRLRDRLEDGQVLGHLNHQEFVLVLPDAGSEEAEECVNELQAMLRSGLTVDNANISLQIRAGVSLFPNHGINASELLRCAGIARGYASHHMGSVGFYASGQEEKSLKLIQIVGDFPRALQCEDLWVEYQPKIDCNTLELCGAEALVRWDHPKLGRLPPDLFVEAIEQAGGISQLTRWVLQEALKSQAGWQRRGLDISMSVNISANDLMDDYLPGYLRELGSMYEFEPQSLTLEVTESAIMHDIDSSLAVIAELRSMGFRISIDDFGTGHSALAQLKRLPVDELKIDKSFVLNIDDRRDEAIVRTAIELAHKFGLTAVAEGVEDHTTLTRLQQLGCELAQGFYFSKPLTSKVFVNWVSAWKAGEGADIVALVRPEGSVREA